MSIMILGYPKFIKLDTDFIRLQGNLSNCRFENYNRGFDKIKNCEKYNNKERRNDTNLETEQSSRCFTFSSFPIFESWMNE